MARIEIATLVRRHRQLEHEIQELTSQLIELTQASVEYEWLSTVPGLGDATIVELLSEIGSFSHYQHPRQLLKLAGLTLRENSSGQHKGQKAHIQTWKKALTRSVVSCRHPDDSP
ncbi:hypothetical protein GCM10020331_093650 [Ectobacillus funiculus]